MLDVSEKGVYIHKQVQICELKSSITDASQVSQLAFYSCSLIQKTVCYHAVFVMFLLLFL